MIQTVCDVCGEPLSDDIIRLRVEDFHLPTFPSLDSEGKRVRRQRLERLIADLQTPNMTLSLDLHRSCFNEDIKPKLSYFYDR